MAFFKRFPRLAAALTMVVAGAAGAQDFPTKPIQLVVPFAPGGFVHLVALMVSEGMGKVLGQPVVVVNQPGANGILAANAVSRAAPDGYTVFLPTVSILAINPHLYKAVQYNPLVDFTPIGHIVSTSNMFVVGADSGIRTFKDLVDRARTRPEAVSYGSSGSGSIQHIVGETLQQQARVKLMHVPYKGLAPALVDVVGGNLTMVYSDASALPQIKAGKLVALAVYPRRLQDQLPGVPSLQEAAAAAGLPQFDAPAIWYGLVAPKGVPRDVVAKLNHALAETLKRPDIRDKMAAAGAVPADNVDAEAFRAIIKADHERYGNLIKTSSISVE